MIPDKDNLKAVLIAIALVLLAEGLAHAQIPGIGGAQAVITVPGSVTSDQAAESSLSDIDTVQLPAILQQDTTTATSVTTGGGGGDYQPNSSYIANLDQSLFSGINNQNFNTWFPGWQALPANSTDTVSIPLTTTVLQTYGQALGLAQSQEQELEGENFSNIESVSTTTTDLLTAVQANTEAVLADIQEHQYMRQELATLITIEATKAGEELNERAQQSATNAMSFNLGTAP
jgi:hypothetical protein